MDRRQTAALLAYVGRLDSRLIRTDAREVMYQLDQWQELLSDVPLATVHGWDACAVAQQYIRTSPYPILPADIGRPWESYKRDRINRHVDPTPSVDPDDQAAWTAELVLTRRAVAVGAAQPVQSRQLTSRPAEPIQEARLEEDGSCIPPEARAMLAPFRRARAAHEAAVARGDLDVLAVGCKQCAAPVGRVCRMRRIAPGGFPRGNTPIVSPHECRVADARRARRTPQPVAS
ncbi:zinc finger domain-containing protein [Streptomyces sp. NPDC003435]